MYEVPSYEEFAAELDVADARYGAMLKRLSTSDARLLDIEARLVALEHPSSTLGRITPVAADAIQYGLNTKFRFGTSMYAGNTAACVGYVVESGVSWWRERLVTNSTAQYLAAQRLAGAGIKLQGTIGTPAAATDWPAMVAHVQDLITDSAIMSVAGWNEPNAAPRPANWAERTVAHQKLLWENFSGLVEVVGPALKDDEPTLMADYAALEALGIGAYCHLGDLHRYPHGGVPTDGLAVRLAAARKMVGGKPVVCSESGYSTFPGSITPAEQGIYAPRQVLDMYLAGVTRFALYEMLDQAPVGTSWPTSYGIISTPNISPLSWVPKPAFSALESLTTALHVAGPAPALDPYPLEVSHSDPLLRSLLVKRNDNKHLLLLWRDVLASYTKTTDVALSNDQGTTTVSVGPEVIRVFV